MLNSVLSLLLLIVGVFLALCAILFLRQESFIFFPGPNDELLALKQQSNRVRIRSSAGALEGWWVENARATNDAVILYFGGNAEDVLFTATTAPLFNARAVLVVNYRGYGRSPGKPGQKALYEDALAIHQYALERGVDAGNIVVMGRSLGSALAAMLAGERAVGGAILVTPFDSMTNVAARHYRFLPVRLLLRHRFPSIEYAKRAQAPALILAAERDTIIPSIHAQRLHDAWAGAKEIQILEGAGHNDIEMHPQYYDAINGFLKRIGDQRIADADIQNAT